MHHSYNESLHFQVSDFLSGTYWFNSFAFWDFKKIYFWLKEFRFHPRISIWCSGKENDRLKWVFYWQDSTSFSEAMLVYMHWKFGSVPGYVIEVIYLLLLFQIETSCVYLGFLLSFHFSQRGPSDKKSLADVSSGKQ